MKHFVKVTNYRPNVDLLVDNILNDSSENIEVVYDAIGEFSHRTGVNDTFSEVSTLIKNQKISKKHIIISESRYNNTKYLDEFDVHFWDTFYITKTYFYLSNQHIQTPEYKYHYICLNGKPRNHRARLIDLLYKENLFDNGCISWNNSEGFDCSYSFKYWTPETIRLDINENHLDIFDANQILSKGIKPDEYEKYKNKIEDITYYPLQFIPPAQFYSSFMQVVAETLTFKSFITEKTAIPLFLQKPFLVVSCKNFHNTLTNYGFKLYDEIFDYSFDSLDTLEERIQGVIDNLNKICSFRLEECTQLYNSILHKLEHNRNRAIEIAKDTDLVPKIILENKKHIHHCDDVFQVLLGDRYE